MAAVHFATIPCVLHTAHKVEGKLCFCNKNKDYCCCYICPCVKNNVHAMFEHFKAFLYAFYERC